MMLFIILLFFQAKNYFIMRMKKNLSSQNLFYYAKKTNLSSQSNNFVWSPKKLCQANKKIQQNCFVAQIPTKLFCWAKKTFVGHTKSLSQCKC